MPFGTKTALVYSNLYLSAEMVTTTVFESLISPLKPLLTEQENQLKSDNYKLSFYFFTQNLIYAIVAQVESIRLLVTTLKSSPDTLAFSLVEASKSMYSEAFRRYDPTLFQKLFLALLGGVPITNGRKYTLRNFSLI
jgi:hypothetical protein